LDSNKLKDINEELNYHTIDANLAWDLNLPLPDNYEFMWIGGHGTGTYALRYFLMHSDAFIPNNFFEDTSGKTGFQRYEYAFNIFVKNPNFKNIINIKEIDFEDFEKFCKLIQKKCKFIFQIRDYFEIFTCYSNHRNRQPNAIMEFDLNQDLYKVFNRFYFFSSGGCNYPRKLKLKDFQSKPLCKEFGFRSCIFEYSMIKIFDNVLDILYIDVKDISGEKTYFTMKKICNFLNLSFKEDVNYAEKYVSNDINILFPLIIDISSKTNNNTKLKIISHNNKFNDDIYQDITSQLSIRQYEYQFKVLIKKDKFLLINNSLLKYLQSYFNNFSNILNEIMKKQKQERVKESDYLDIYRLDRDIRQKLYQMCNYELTHIKEHRPDIIASWKYYQEFEKMCKELDG
ncbi:DUF2972 domain-containing protein, partial [Campylobacter sp. TTU_617]|uniref:DUF2972 domain-containing protein n=1 Tax=Campylobacter sp. TTU_617 TaxID=2768148 RepID=UPI001905DE78